MKYFCPPADFKYETIDRYAELNSQYGHSKITETYGQLAPDSLFGSCRSPKNLPAVDMEQLEKYVKYSRDKGIEFNYVINASCMGNDELVKEGFHKVCDFLEKLQEIGVQWITLCLPSLMEIAKYKAPGLKIKASTVCLINSPTKAEFYDELGIKRLVLDEDIYKRFDILKNIRKAYSGDLEIIVNSFCRTDCPYKTFHYNSFSHSHLYKDKYPYYGTRCNNIHIGGENLIRLNWIRPEDLHHYSEIGIDYFKFQGRSNVLDGNPAKAVTHYIEENYEGDLISLLELFSESRPFAITMAEMDNRKLDGFLDRFVQDPGFCSKLCRECGYCAAYANAAISRTDAAIMDMAKLMYRSTMEEFPGMLCDCGNGCDCMQNSSSD